MAGITLEQAKDLGIATLQAFDQDDVQIAMKHSTYEVINRWFGAEKRVYSGGKKVTFDLTVKDTGNAAHVNMYQALTPNVANVNVEGEVNWVHFENNFSYSLKELSINQNDKYRIFDLLKNRRANCIRESGDVLEECGWKTPSSATDNLVPNGIPAWLVQADTSAVTGAFEGYVGDYTVATVSTESAYATVAGLACTSTTNARWANWYANHANRLDDYLMKLLRRGFRKTNFQTPKLAGQAIDPQSGFYNFRLYTNSAVLDAVEEMATKSDDRIGADFGKYAGNVVFKGIPLVYVDSLDDDLTYVRGKDPIYGVNHNHFKVIVLSNENFRWDKPINDREQHDVFTVYLNLSYAYICNNRRAGGFLINNWESAY